MPRAMDPQSGVWHASVVQRPVDFRVLVVVVWDSKGRATRCGSRGRCSPVTKGEAVIGGGIGVLRARNREDSNRLRGRGGCYLEEVFWWRPVFITQYGGREVAGAADGVQVLAGSVKLLSSQGESGNNIGPPPIPPAGSLHRVRGGFGGISREGEAANLG